MKQYVLVTHWHLDAPIERVWGVKLLSTRAA